MKITEEVLRQLGAVWDGSYWKLECGSYGFCFLACGDGWMLYCPGIGVGNKVIRLEECFGIVAERTSVTVKDRMSRSFRDMVVDL